MDMQLAIDEKLAGKLIDLAKSSLALVGSRGPYKVERYRGALAVLDDVGAVRFAVNEHAWSQLYGNKEN